MFKTRLDEFRLLRSSFYQHIAYFGIRPIKQIAEVAEIIHSLFFRSRRIMEDCAKIFLGGPYG